MFSGAGYEASLVPRHWVNMRPVIIVLMQVLGMRPALFPGTGFNMRPVLIVLMQVLGMRPALFPGGGYEASLVPRWWV